MKTMTTIPVPDHLYEVLQHYALASELDPKDIARKLLLYVLKHQQEDIDQMLNKMNHY
jgi:hypothetical protein